MSSAYLSPSGRPSVRGASALSAEDGRRRHVVGNALRAIRVYAEAAFSVAVLGEYAEPAPVVRR